MKRFKNNKYYDEYGKYSIGYDLRLSESVTVDELFKRFEIAKYHTLPEEDVEEYKDQLVVDWLNHTLRENELYGDVVELKKFTNKKGEFIKVILNKVAITEENINIDLYKTYECDEDGEYENLIHEVYVIS